MILMSHLVSSAAVNTVALVFSFHCVINILTTLALGSGTVIHNPSIPLWSQVQYLVQTSLNKVVMHWANQTKLYSLAEAGCVRQKG